ncbi:SusC/RagA family TonB-linked outer membrane protein [Sphingobacterium rhinopitheci]|uniref:SusC/RagA family TonB-linked outer membrane protein n=1 Tax=Sphingobacterium rhinopitheci TaxID=2781960 RepID=UPI001F51AA5C|nr:TonB-dependent receptor [Sphingobacterium rhinopitheci]MCI0922343.1 TonB-dependent receptor [Sphingobacterium rhinopitheci]
MKKLIMRYLLMWIFLQLGLNTFSQQGIDVNGKVVDDNSNAISGVTIDLIHKKNNKKSTVIADANGLFKLNSLIEGDAYSIYAHHLGYSSDSITNFVASSTTKNTILFRLKSNSDVIDEVVVVGYGTQKASTVTGSIVDVKGDVLERAPVMNFTNTLAGRLPGLVATTGSGEPGSDNSTLRIRGANTLGDNSPLIVVDGIANRSIERINPQDIESVTVLKDASAAIYGSQAANGVILVTTKKGRLGRPQVTLTHNQGWSQPTILPKAAESSEYAQMLNEISIYAGQQPKYTEDELELFRNGSEIWKYPNTDWYSETFNSFAPQQKTAININGGSEYINYYISGGYDKQDAIYKNSGTKFNQYNFRSNLNGKLNDHIKYGINTAMREYNRNYPTRSASDIFTMILRGKPNLHAYWPSGENGPDIEYGNNPVVITTNQTGYDRNKTMMLESRANIEINIPYVDGLSISGNIGYDRTMNNEKLWQTPWTLYNWDGYSVDNNGSPALEAGLKGFTAPQLRQDFDTRNLLTLNALVRYEYDFDLKNHLNVLVGVEKIKGDNMNFYASRRYYVSSAIEELFAGGDAEKDNSGASASLARLNYFGRVNYDYDGKYLLEFLWRYDGSYKFPESKRFGFFPGVSAGWRISNEKFWGSFKTYVNDLKIRGSWGKTGNDRIDDYQFMSSYGFLTGLTNTYVFNGAQENKILNELRIPNPNVTWEVANQSNIGIDAKFLNSKISFTAEYFYNKRSNILWNRNASVPSSSGLSLPRENIGEVSNQGFEIQLGYADKINEFNYSINGNIATNRNKIIFWDETPGVPEYQKSTGKPMNANLYYNAIGIFKDANALAEYPHWAGSRPGDIIFEDVNNDGKIDGLDRVRANKTELPTLTAGLNLDLSYKQFYTSIFFQGAFGAMRNSYYEMQGEVGNYLKQNIDGRWTPENVDAVKPRIWNRYNEYWRSNQNTYWLEKSNYVRLKNFEFGYTFNENFSKKLKISKLQIFFSGQNLITWTKVNDFDPETTSATAYPLNRVYNLGISLTF